MSAVRLAALVPAIALLGGRASDERAGFVTTLGRDTVALESFTRSPSRLEGDIALRIPGTVLFHYQLDLRDDGTVSRSMVDMNPLGAPEIVSTRVTLDFLGDSLRVTIDSRGKRSRSMRPLERASVPFLMTGFDASYGLYSSLGILELLVSRLPVSATDTVAVSSIGVATGDRVRRKFMRRTATSADVDYFLAGWTHMSTDEGGQIQTVDMRQTTEKTVAARTAFMDVAQAAKSFADRDRAGTGLGVASPNQKVTATIGGSGVFIGYGSPRARGRAILGGVIPYDRVWRTGANEATVFVTDRDLVIGDAVVPAGSYSLWTLPTRTGVQLIVNRGSGQWGTSYDSTLDLARVPMQIRSASAPQEAFAIALVGAGNTAELRLAWDTFVWTVPVVAK